MDNAPRRLPSPMTVLWRLLRMDEQERAEEPVVTAVLAACPEMREVGTLARSLFAAIRNRKHEELGPWLSTAARCPFPELWVLAAGIERDRMAVEAALHLPWSTGQVEGQNHRLKLVKRQMYGRAGFDLLRQRVLHAV